MGPGLPPLRLGIHNPQAEALGAEILEKASARGAWKGSVLRQRDGLLVQTYYLSEGENAPPYARTLIRADGSREKREVNLD